MSTYAVGDIQGCLAPLKKLLDQVKFNPEKDQLWCAGDLINRGPDSLETLRYLKSLGNSVTCVLGNHDLHLLALVYASKPKKTDPSLSALMAAPDKEELLDWLRQWPLFHYDSKLKYAMVHAGIPPQWKFKDCTAYSAEVEHWLQGSKEDLQQFLDNMYGDQPNLWSDDLKDFDRLRLIVNYFTRMRFCTDNGQLELDAKSSPKHAPEGYAPWFSFPRNNATKGLIFGHWAALEGQIKEHQQGQEDENLFALDTGCVWGGCLTLLQLETRQLIQCKCS